MAESREEDLTGRAELRAQADDAGNLFQLIADLRLRKRGRERRAARRRFQQRVERQRIAHGFVGGSNHLIAAAGGEYLLLRRRASLRRRRRPQAHRVLIEIVPRLQAGRLHDARRAEERRAVQRDRGGKVRAGVSRLHRVRRPPAPAARAERVRVAALHLLHLI